MAMAYVYRHRSGGSNRRAVGVTGDTLINGQLIFFPGRRYTDSRETLHEFYYYNYSNGKWTQGLIASSNSSNPNNGEIVNGSGDRIYYLSLFNRTVYGSAYAHGSGSHYGLRRSVALARPNSSGTGWNPDRILSTSDRVIIAHGQGHTYSNTINSTVNEYVRCWGYRTSSGSVVETFGLYVAVTNIFFDPGSYGLNTR